MCEELLDIVIPKMAFLKSGPTDFLGSNTEFGVIAAIVLHVFGTNIELGILSFKS